MTVPYLARPGRDGNGKENRDMWYVIQTTTGKEQELVAMIHKTLPASVYQRCFFMKRQLMKRLGGEWLEVTETLFPAYVFLETDSVEEIFYGLKGIPEFTRLLGDKEGEIIPLEREEELFFRKLCRGETGYLVKNTTVYLDEDKGITRLEGPLEEFKDRILRVNLRKRYAIIEISMRGEKGTAMLGIRLEKDNVWNKDRK